MNGLSLSIVTLIHYNVIIRDTLEYTLNRPNYPVESFKYKKEHILREIEEKTALQQFLEKNKEFGDKVIEKIKDLYASVYADDSTICRIANNELRVDHGQHLTVLDKVIPLHEDVKRIIDAHIGFARKNNVLEESILKLAAADERMYRGVVLLSLYQELQKLFAEYGKARAEAKGALTPQSNFVQGEIIRVVKHIHFMRDNLSATDEETWNVMDYVNKTVDYTSGRRDLPNGKKFQDIFADGSKLIHEFIAKKEAEWKALYQPAVQELVDLSKKNNGQINVSLKPEEKKD